MALSGMTLTISWKDKLFHLKGHDACTRVLFEISTSV